MILQVYFADIKRKEKRENLQLEKGVTFPQIGRQQKGKDHQSAKKQMTGTPDQELQRFLFNLPSQTKNVWCGTPVDSPTLMAAN